MKVQYWEDMANHSDPESCVARREVWIEALTGETGRPAIEPRNHSIGVPMVLLCQKAKQQVAPMIKTLQDQESLLGAVTTLIADTGFCSESNVNACSQAGIEPLIAQTRQDHHATL